MAHYETLRRRLIVAHREGYKARRAEHAARIVSDVMRAVDAACENPRFDERGLVVVDLSAIQADAAKYGLGDMPVFSTLGE